MAYSNFSGKRAIPSISSRKTQPVTVDFSKGVNTYKPNDDMDANEIRLAENARFDKVGEYGTRKGLTKLIEPIGYTKTFGAFVEDPNMVEASQARDVGLTIGKDTYIYSVKVKLQRNGDRYVVPKLTLSADHGSEAISTSCVNLKEDNDIHTYEFIFLDAPLFKAQSRLVATIGVQSGGIDDFLVSTNGSGTMEIELYTATRGEVVNVFEANTGSLGGTTLFILNHIENGKRVTSLYHVYEASGIIRRVKDFENSADHARFLQLQDKVYCVADGNLPWRIKLFSDGNKVEIIEPIDLETETRLDITMNNIMGGQEDNVIYGVSSPNTELAWTYPYGYTFAKSPSFTTTEKISATVGTDNIISQSSITPSANSIRLGDWIVGSNGEVARVTFPNPGGAIVRAETVSTVPKTINSYDKFSVDFYQNFPAINTGDPITAMFSMGGVVYVMTKKRKYQMFSQTADSWTQSPCSAQKGTFTQESLVSDINYTYFASDDGVYMFDGSSEMSITDKQVQDVYDQVKHKESIVLDIFNNRLYVFFPKGESPKNDHCMVYNLNLRVWESIDSNMFISSTCARNSKTGRFLCGSSNWGIVLANEDGDYSDVGQPISFNLETAYQHFGAPSQLKRITKWRPDFASTKEPYTVECGYAHDFSEDVRYAFSIDLKGREFIDTGYIWDNPEQYGNPTSPTVHTTIPRVNGEFYRTQIRYQHIASFEPVIMRSHTLTVQSQRIR